MNRTLVLASSSPYRRELLRRLGLPFETAKPRVDEQPLPGERPQMLVRRLAETKARAVAARYSDALIVGSDQLALLDGRALGKPGTRENAIRQLEATSRRRVRFLTGLCLLDTRADDLQSDVVPFDVVFRALSMQQIQRYVDADQPLDCAGSFKCEGLGIALFERMRGDDPTALIGLPLIRLVGMLDARGISIP